MITNYDIDKKLYASLKERFEMPQTPVPGMVYVSGGVYNGDRPLNSESEDMTVRTLSVVGDGFPQEAVTNVNVYVADVAEAGGGYVRDGKMLEILSEAVADYIETLSYPNMAVSVDTIAEVPLEQVHQHYVNFRLRVYVYGEISNN